MKRYEILVQSFPEELGLIWFSSIRVGGGILLSRCQNGCFKKARISPLDVYQVSSLHPDCFCDKCDLAFDE